MQAVVNKDSGVKPAGIDPEIRRLQQQLVCAEREVGHRSHSSALCIMVHRRPLRWLKRPCALHRETPYVVG